MKKHFELYYRLKEMGIELTVKWYKSGVKNEFTDYQEAANFLNNPQNAHLFDHQTDYSIKEIYTKDEE